jgi:hypothetical protein
MRSPTDVSKSSINWRADFLARRAPSMQTSAEELGLPADLPFKLDIPRLKSLLVASQQKANPFHPRPAVPRRNPRNHNCQAGRRNPAAAAAAASDGDFESSRLCHCPRHPRPLLPRSSFHPSINSTPSAPLLQPVIAHVPCAQRSRPCAGAVTCACSPFPPASSDSPPPPPPRTGRR